VIPPVLFESGSGTASSDETPIPVAGLQAVLNNELSRNLRSASESSDGSGTQART